MPTMPFSGRRPASARRLLAVLTAAFLLFQQAIILVPTASAQTRRPAALGRTTVTKAPARVSAPTLADDPGLPGAPSTTVVISQVYGGAGCGTAGCSTYKNDYIELFNRGTSAQSLNGWSVQYAAATGTAWQVTNLTNVTLQPGQYYLVAQGAGANGVNNIPTPDATGTVAMSATSAKVAVVNTTTALSGQCGNGATGTLPASVIDFVGYGANANCNDAGATTGGAGNAPAPSTTTADVRAGAGCTDTDNNSADFTATTPNPRNTSTALNACSAPPAGVNLSINDVSQNEGNSGTTAFTFTVSLSSSTHGGVTFDIATADGTAQDGNPGGEDTDYQANSATGVTIPNGSQSAQFTVQVNGDTTTESNETFFVNVTNVAGATVTDGQGQGTIVNDDISLVLISQVQGSGASSPVAGSTVSVRGIVTLLRTNGFFLQEEVADNDSDPNTSEGIFVFTTAAPAVAVGDQATVTGNVVEFNGLTEISASNSNVVVNSTGNTLPTAVTIDATILDPASSYPQPQLEKYEGMRMAAAALRTVSPNDGFFDVITVLPSVPRQQVFREPGIPSGDPVPPDPTTGTPDCCIPIWDRNPERLKLDTNGRAGAPGVAYTSNVTLSNVAGPLDYSFGEYRLIPEATPTASPNMTAVPVLEPEADEFTIASYNLENFNNNATQREKASLTVRNVLHYPDIIGMVEIFDLADLRALRDEINNDAVAASEPNPQYEAYLVEADGTSEDSDQDVGFLVKTSRVQVNSVTQEREEETYINPNNGQAETLHDRPPFVLDATVEPAGANPQRVLVIVNHLRSFIDIEHVAGEGPRVREKRKKQAESLAGLFQELQTNNPGVPIVSVGDYNAFQFNSGYDDSISVLKGNPTPDDQIVVDQSPDLVNPNFINLIDTMPASERYSFFFSDDGAMQTLDHHLVNQAARTRNTLTAIARVNSDFPEVPAATYATNASTPERNSDHDPVVSYYSLGTAQAVGALMISEFRFRGPGGVIEAGPGGGDTLGADGAPASSDPGGPNAPGTVQDNDEFVEFYNNTDADLTVDTLDGSEGWALVAADGVTRFIIPNGTVIPARGHFLAVNLDGYSLSDYGAGDPVKVTGEAEPVEGYTIDIPDNSGIALFNTADPANFSAASRLDAAGYSTAPELYREGAGFPTGGGETTSNLEHSFVRKLCAFVQNVGCTTPGTPKDTGDNLTDFVVVNTDGASTALGAKLGAPGPEGTLSPRRFAQVPVALLDPSTSSAQAPNRVRDFTSVPANNSTFGTLSIRRTVTNNTGAPVSYLGFRIVEITTHPSPSGTADLRAIDSGDITVTVGGNPVDVRGTYVEQPPMQPNGGGHNSSMGVGYINLEGNVLPVGESVSVQFLLGIQQTGTFRFYITVELLNDAPPLQPSLLKFQQEQKRQGRRARGRRR